MKTRTFGQHDEEQELVRQISTSCGVNLNEGATSFFPSPKCRSRRDLAQAVIEQYRLAEKIYCQSTGETWACAFARIYGVLTP